MEHYYCQQVPALYKKAIDNLVFCSKLQQAFTSSTQEKRRALSKKSDMIGTSQIYDREIQKHEAKIKQTRYDFVN